MSTRFLTTGLVAFLALQLAACGNATEEETTAATDSAPEMASTQYGAEAQTADNSAGETEMPLVASAQLNPTEGNNVSGLVTFEATDGGVRVVADINGLSGTQHGFHIHEFGDCSAPDGTSAGGHFNPAGVAHGGPDSDVHHVGDLGNLAADENGQALKDRVFPMLSLTGENSIVGKGVIVHAQADDLVSQPTGAAGARVACGVITEATQ
jgi:Cu-Zn family superoxide dismutase